MGRSYQCGPVRLGGVNGRQQYSNTQVGAQAIAGGLLAVMGLLPDAVVAVQRLGRAPFHDGNAGGLGEHGICAASGGADPIHVLPVGRTEEVVDNGQEIAVDCPLLPRCCAASVEKPSMDTAVVSCLPPLYVRFFSREPTRVAVRDPEKSSLP